MKNPHIKQFLLVQSGGFWLVTIIFVPLYSFLTISEAAFLDLGCIFPRWDGSVSLENREALLLWITVQHEVWKNPGIWPKTVLSVHTDIWWLRLRHQTAFSATRWTQIRGLAVRTDWAGRPYVSAVRGSILSGHELFWSGWFLMWNSASAMFFFFFSVFFVVVDSQWWPAQTNSPFWGGGSHDFFHVGFMNVSINLGKTNRLVSHTGPESGAVSILGCFVEIWVVWNEWRSRFAPGVFGVHYRMSGAGQSRFRSCLLLSA